MHIQWYGQTFIKMQIKSPQNGDSNLLIDPFTVKTIGLRQPKMDADMILMTNGKLDKSLKILGDYFLIDSPGEYELNQIFVYGISEYNGGDIPTGKIIYSIEAEDMNIVYLGKINQKDLTSDQLIQLENADVLFIPIGGNDSLNAKQAAHLVQAIEPRIIIPIYYKFTGSKLPLDTVDQFIKELGIAKVEKTEKIKIIARNLPQDDNKLIVLQP